MDESDRQTVTNLCQTFTADELRRAVLAFTGVDHPTIGTRALATVLVASGYGVAEVRAELERQRGEQR